LTGKAVTLTLPRVLEKEVLYNQDLNGDGDIGDTIDTVIDNATYDAMYGLYKMVSGNYVVAEADLSEGDNPDIQILLTDSKGVAWSTKAPLAALDYWIDDQEEVLAVITATGAGSKGVYTKELFIPTEDYASAKSTSAAKTISYTDALLWEQYLEQDITDDGNWGPTVGVVADESDALGYAGLYKLAETGAFVISDPGLFKDDVFDHCDVLYADKTGKLWLSTASQFALYIDDSSELPTYSIITKTGTAYAEETFTTSADWTIIFSKKTTLTAAQLIDKEYDYYQDINGDEYIGEADQGILQMKLIGVEDQQATIQIG
jgi:hypothetical protein